MLMEEEDALSAKREKYDLKQSEKARKVAEKEAKKLQDDIKRSGLRRNAVNSQVSISM
jgi:hypothetical protein